VGIALPTYGVACRVHLDTERVGHGVGADSLEAVKLSRHLADMDLHGSCSQIDRDCVQCADHDDQYVKHDKFRCQHFIIP